MVKVPKFLNEAEYERKLNILVNNLEDRIRVIHSRVGRGAVDSRMQRLYLTFLSSNEPLTARDAAEKSGAFDLTTQHMLYRVVVQRLTESGWLIPVDSVPRSWSMHTSFGGGGQVKRMVARFKAVENNNPSHQHRIGAVINKFLYKVEALDKMRLHGVCVAAAVQQYPHTFDLRRERIFEMRAADNSLDEIGKKYQVSRERIRQIIEQTIKRGLAEGE